ncbi:DNA helicase MCM8 [Trichoplax sp. H2]|nr:DNA helicase MCM8 [Trichoplax sp. H2]|eukprot:RDD46487.1 DNA helicase MCM8 [Trichoplax sp. H2]
MSQQPGKRNDKSNTNNKTTAYWKKKHFYDKFKNNKAAGHKKIIDKKKRNPGHTPRLTQTTLTPSPYEGWKLYFDEELYSPSSDAAYKVKAFMKFFTNYLYDEDKTQQLDLIFSTKSLVIDFGYLKENEELLSECPSIADEITEQPHKIINCMGLAAYEVLTSMARYGTVNDHDVEEEDLYPFRKESLPKISVRISNYEPVIPLKSLKANYYGKLVAVHGTVVRVSNIKPLAVQMAFTCNTCGDMQVMRFLDGNYKVPNKCVSSECKGRSFSPDVSSKHTATVDWQTIRESGRVPRTVECELIGNIVSSCVPGDLVNVVGIVKIISSDEGRNKNKDKCMYLLYINVNHLENFSSKKKSLRSLNPINDNAAFSMKELFGISEIHGAENPFRLIVGSICPSIYGHEMVKAGLALALFGGRHKYLSDSNNIPVRGDPHMLVIGDPGLGKSQMLQAVANIAPRGVYVCGNTTTKSGLTVTLTKDGSTGNYSLEAGALVLADQGCCCIDEFDKMSNQHQALLEAMEQQSISIAKAGVTCSLPARTSVIAAANPVGGHYDLSKTVSENLKLGSALLSRFDLVFILLDKPDADMDSMISEHVMSLHSGIDSHGNVLQATVRRLSQRGDSQSELEAEESLVQTLKIRRGESFAAIPATLLRKNASVCIIYYQKYVSYTRLYVHPKLSKEAADILQEFYLNLRQQRYGSNITPITTRQLESLIRLTEARARLEMRVEATKQDALDVIEIMKNSMLDIFSDEYGRLDFQRSQNGSGMSSRSRGKRFIGILNNFAGREGKSIFSVQEMSKIARDASFDTANFDDLIYSLNNQGYLLKKGYRVYQLQTLN